MGEKDTVSKALLKRIVVDLAHYLLEMDIEVLETETQRIEHRRADLVVLAREDGREFLLHIEIQNDNLAEVPLRMLRYLTDLMLAHPHREVRQSVIYIGKARLAMDDGVQQPNLDFRYRLIDMHQVDCKVFLQRDDPDALVLAILCDFKGRNEREVVREILTRLRALTQATPQRFGEYLTMLEVLSTNRNLKDCIIEEEKMLNIAIEELPSYEIGMEKGIEQGRQRGNHETAEALLIRLLEVKFGTLAATDLQRISDAPTEQLMDWSGNALRASTIADVFV
jgi:hypothetical protein